MYAQTDCMLKFTCDRVVRILNLNTYKSRCSPPVLVASILPLSSSSSSSTTSSSSSPTSHHSHRPRPSLPQFLLQVSDGGQPGARVHLREPSLLPRCPPNWNLLVYREALVDYAGIQMSDSKLYLKKFRFYFTKYAYAAYLCIIHSNNDTYEYFSANFLGFVMYFV